MEKHKATGTPKVTAVWTKSRTLPAPAITAQQLRERIAKAIRHFDEFERSPGYYREGPSDGDMAIIERTPHPRYVKTRIEVARLAIDAAHRDMRLLNVPDRPKPRSLESVEETAKHLSEMIDCVDAFIASGKAPSAQHKKPSKEPVDPRLDAIKKDMKIGPQARKIVAALWPHGEENAMPWSQIPAGVFRSNHPDTVKSGMLKARNHLGRRSAIHHVELKYTTPSGGSDGFSWLIISPLSPGEK